MRLLKLIPTLCGCLVAGPSNAIDPDYYKPIVGYAVEMDREPIDVKNLGIHSVAAHSKVHRATHKALANVHTTVANRDSKSADPDSTGGDINIASPHIEGGNRGNITIIVEKGAIKGSITTVRK